MIQKFKRAITAWEYHDLKFFLKELDIGGKNLKKVVKERIVEIESRASNDVCPVCSEPIRKEEAYSITFGAKWLRKRANFCAIDCMQYFLTQMNDAEKAKSLKPEQ